MPVCVPHISQNHFGLLSGLFSTFNLTFTINLLFRKSAKIHSTYHDGRVRFDGWDLVSTMSCSNDGMMHLAFNFAFTINGLFYKVIQFLITFNVKLISWNSKTWLELVWMLEIANWVYVQMNWLDFCENYMYNNIDVFVTFNFNLVSSWLKSTIDSGRPLS